MTLLSKRTTAALASVLVVSACMSAPSFYDNYKAGNPLRAFPYKAGVGWAEIDRDKTNCEIEAAQRVPQNIVVQSSPTYTTPTQTYCNQIGTQTFCNTTGGQTYGGQTTSSDANAGLRVRAYGQCMAQRGYRFVDIPACPPGTDISSQHNETVLRPLSRRTCYQAYESGGYAIGDG
jgi:hypothetical protein